MKSWICYFLDYWRFDSTIKDVFKRSPIGFHFDLFLFSVFSRPPVNLLPHRCEIFPQTYATFHFRSLPKKESSEKSFDYLWNRDVFFSRPFNEYFKLLKHCPNDFHKSSHSHLTPRGAPACPMASTSNDWDVRNISKFNPKMTKNSHLWTFFSFFKNSKTVKNMIRTKFYRPSTQYSDSKCALAIKSYDWHLRNIAKINPKITQNHYFPFFSFFSKTSYDSKE